MTLPDIVKDELAVIPGSVPNLINLPPGCRFAPRCLARVENGLEICVDKEPDLLPPFPNHTVRCWLYHESEGKGYKAHLNLAEQIQ